jgi:hypothetical protein
MTTSHLLPPYYHPLFISLSFSKDFRDEIQSTKGVMLRGLNDYMILDEQTFRIRNDQGTLLV